MHIVVNSQENMCATTKKHSLKCWDPFRYAVWCPVHSQSGIRFGYGSFPLFPMMHHFRGTSAKALLVASSIIVYDGMYTVEKVCNRWILPPIKVIWTSQSGTVTRQKAFNIQWHVQQFVGGYGLLVKPCLLTFRLAACITALTAWFERYLSLA